MKRRHAAVIAVGVLLLLVGVLPAMAQNFQGINTLENIQTVGQGVGKHAINIAFTFCGIVGAVCLIPAAIKAFKGEAQSKDAITGVGLGLITVFIILAVLKTIMAFS